MLLAYLLEQPGAHASPKGVIEHQQRKLLLGIPWEPGEAQAYMHLLYVLFHRPEAFFLYELVLWGYVAVAPAPPVKALIHRGPQLLHLKVARTGHHHVLWYVPLVHI